jgi:hypothetical protein
MEQMGQNMIIKSTERERPEETDSVKGEAHEDEQQRIRKRENDMKAEVYV